MWTARKASEWDAAMTINLKPEQERIIQAEIESGYFRSPDEVLDCALATLKEKEYNRKGAMRRKNLAQFLMESPLAGADLNLEREKDYGRPIEL
jgi:Arc/MetJ-type ribon-helix-helix transcriptional regulator